jgi:multiple sugar transport system permease protein
MKFSPTLYVLLMILFASASFFIITKINQKKKQFASKYPNLSRSERLERMKQERLEFAQAKKEMRKAIKIKKQEWKEEDKRNDEIARANVLALKAEVEESKAVFEKVKAEYFADKENPELEALYLDTMKKHDRLCQKLRIEKDRISLIRRIERWSKRGGRLRRELFIKRQYYYLVTPYALLFVIFTVIPVAMSLILSFTYFNLLEFPTWVGWENYMRLFVDDKVFIIAIRNTLILAIITGPLSYLSAFVFAWLINELRPRLRAFMTLIFYAPSISGNVYLVWKLIFSSDMYGYANAFLLNYNFIDEPILWLQNPKYIIWIIMLVQLWLSLGVSFLAFIAGLQSVNRELYEAGAIDGIKNRWQELWFITLPQMKSQLMFGAVMQITSSLAIAEVATQLAGFPSIEYAGHTIITHLMDYGSLRMEMGYASSIATILFFMMIGANLLVRKVLRRVGS